MVSIWNIHKGWHLEGLLPRGQIQLLRGLSDWLAHKSSDLDLPCMDYWGIVKTEEGDVRSEEEIWTYPRWIWMTPWGYVLGCHHCWLSSFFPPPSVLLSLSPPFSSFPSFSFLFLCLSPLSSPLLPLPPFWDSEITLTKRSKQANKNHTLGLNQNLWLLIFIDNQAGFRINLDTPLGAPLRRLPEKV